MAVKKIGLTGGIGSGKSFVSKIFILMGIPVYYSDDQAKRLMVEDPDLVKSIKKHFGKEAYKKKWNSEQEVYFRTDI